MGRSEVYCTGMSQQGRHNCSLVRKPFIMSSIHGCWPRPHHITINLQQDILYYAVYWNAAPLNWWNCLKIILRLTVRMTCVAPWKLIRSHAVTPCWLDDKECIRSGWRKQCDSPQHTKVRKLHFSKIIWRLALGFSMDLRLNATSFQFVWYLIWKPGDSNFWVKIYLALESWSARVTE